MDLIFLLEKVISEKLISLVIIAFAVMMLSLNVRRTSSNICSKFRSSSSVLYLCSSLLTSVNSIMSLFIFVKALSTIFKRDLNSLSSFGDTSLNSSIADINNNSSDSYGGAITAALFLKEFVTDDIPWLHFDLMAWNLRSRPGRPQGGEAMGLRALFAYLENRFA